MADNYITEDQITTLDDLTKTTNIYPNDLLYILQDPETSKVSHKLELAQLIKNHIYNSETNPSGDNKQILKFDNGIDAVLTSEYDSTTKDIIFRCLNGVELFRLNISDLNNRDEITGLKLNDGVLKLNFRRYNGTTSMDDLVSTSLSGLYTQGDGIQINSSKISIKLNSKDSGYLQIDEYGNLILNPEIINILNNKVDKEEDKELISLTDLAQIKTNKTNIDSLTDRVNTTESEVSDIKNNLSNQLDKNTKDISDISTDIGSIETNINTIESTLTNKVDKEFGKRLSSEDFTKDDKEIIESYDRRNIRDQLRLLSNASTTEDIIRNINYINLVLNPKLTPEVISTIDKLKLVPITGLDFELILNIEDPLIEKVLSQVYIPELPSYEFYKLAILVKDYYGDPILDFTDYRISSELIKCDGYGIILIICDYDSDDYLRTSLIKLTDFLDDSSSDSSEFDSSKYGSSESSF